MKHRLGNFALSRLLGGEVAIFLPPKYICPSCDSTMLSLTKNPRKYWPRAADEIAFSTLVEDEMCSESGSRVYEPRVFIERFDLNHIVDRKYKSLEGNFLLVFYDNHNFFNVALPNTISEGVRR